MIPIFLLAITFFFISCSEIERDNPEDIHSINYGKTRLCPDATVGSNTVTCGGQTYRTIEIGDRVWMAENINYNANSSKCYENQESYCATYGRLYNWATAKIVCPKGWHLPSNAEWDVLFSFVEGNDLKASDGFAALPGGRGSGSSFIGIGYNGYWWSSSEYDIYAYYRQYSDYDTGDLFDSKSYLFSVRCVRD